MTHPKQDVTRAHMGMLAWALIVGLSFPAVGLLSEGLPPLWLTAIRFVIASLALLPLAWQSPDRRPSLVGLVVYAGMGLCLAGFFGAMFWAAHRVTAVSMATLYVSVPLLAYGLGRAIGVEPRAGRLLALLSLGAVGALGLAWAENGGNSGGLRFGVGEAVFFAGCAASALYPVLSKWGLARGLLAPQAAVRTFWSLLMGSVQIALLALLLEPPGLLAGMTASDWLLVTYLALFSSGVTFWLMQQATGALTPGAVTAYSYLVPFVSMLILFAVQPSSIGWHWLPGSLLVLTAIGLLLRRDVTGRVQPAGPTSGPATGPVVGAAPDTSSNH